MIQRDPDGVYFLRAPGVILRSYNPDLIWPSLFTAMIVYRQQLIQAHAEGKVLEFWCAP